MRTLAIQTITAAAVACGLPVQGVYLELERADSESVFLPERRLEIQVLDEELTRQGWRVARITAEDAAICRTRYAEYRCRLPVRVLVRGDDQTWLDAFCRAFLLALPGKTRDGAGNPVRVAASRAIRKGYTFASIRIEEKCTQALHIHFTGIIHKDVDTGFITHITLHPRYEEAT